LQANVERFFSLGEGELRLKAGVKSRSTDRTMNNARQNYQWLGRGDEQVFMTDYIVGDGRAPGDVYGIDIGVISDPVAFAQGLPALAQDPNFRLSSNNLGDDYTNDESVDALYAMGTYNQGPFTLVAGVRREKTESVSSGRSQTLILDWDETAGELIRVLDERVPITANAAYSNSSPALIGSYNLNANTVLRAAWTNTIGRPAYNQYAPRFSRSAGEREPGDNGELVTFLSINGGNPNLSAFESENLDLSLEYYFGSAGIFSVGLFKKDIKNFLSSTFIEQEDVAVSSLPEEHQEFFRQASNADTVGEYFYSFTRNERDASIEGIEVAYRQKFDFLPDGWDNFGVDMNVSIVDGQENLENGTTRGFLMNQFDEVFNGQLFYETDRYSARLAYNHHGPLYHRSGSSPLGYRADGTNQFYDFSFQYRFGDRNDDSQWSLFFDIKNVFDDLTSRRIWGGFDGVPELVAGNETPGRTWIIGAKLKM